MTQSKGREADRAETQSCITYFPVFLNLTGKKAVVVGGGSVAERKILSLIKAGAEVTVISPHITKRVQREISRQKIFHIPREYKKGDLKDAFLAIAATDSPRVNEKVFRDAGCLLNVVDTPALCNFIVPSSMRNGPLTIAVSTSGVSPALARTLRSEIERSYGSELGGYLKALKKIRADAMKTIPGTKKRSLFLKSVASEEILRILREKGEGEAVRFARELLQRTIASQDAVSDVADGKKRRKVTWK